jgi:hypothetical protein
MARSLAIATLVFGSRGIAITPVSVRSNGYQRRKVESYLRQILKHLLLYQYWRLEDCLHHWEIELDNFRTELKSLVKSKTF